MTKRRTLGHTMAALLFSLLVSCTPNGTATSPRPALALKAALTFRSALKTQAVAADIHHLTFNLVNASDGTTVAATVEATPPFASPLTLQIPAPPDGNYKLTVEAFGGTAATTSLTVGGALASSNFVTVTGLVPTYSSGTAVTFPAQLYLKSGGSVAATVTGTGTSRIDAAVYSGATQLAETLFSPASFPVTNLPPGTYTLQVKRYDTDNVTVLQTLTSNVVTVGGPETGYAADGALTVAF